jgi:hypothetical protein
MKARTENFDNKIREKDYHIENLNKELNLVITDNTNLT